MCNNFPNIKVVEGNAFSVLVPLKVRTFESCRPIDEDIDPTKLSNVVFKFGGVSYTPIVDERGVAAVLPATLARGTYDIVVTADYEDNPIRAAYEGAITIVPWNSQSDAQQYLPGSPIVLEAAYIIGGALTDAELEALKEEYREKNAQLQQAIEDAEEAKREWEQKAADLDGVAQEATSQEILTAVENIDFSEVAKQGTNPNANISDIQAEIDAISPDIILGKQQLAAAITEQGVPTTSAASLSQMAENVSQIVSDNLDTNGTEWAGDVPTNINEALYRSRPNLITITNYDNIPENATMFSPFVNLKKIVFENATDLVNANFYNGNICPNVLEIVAPLALRVSDRLKFDSAVFQRLYLPKATPASYGFRTIGEGVYRCVNLIDIFTGENFTITTDTLKQWSPTNALLANSQSLLTEEDIAAGFTSNLEKLLYNIREHIAANLPDRTGLSSCTLTMSANIKAAINGDTATANAFANKNWIIA